MKSDSYIVKNKEAIRLSKLMSERGICSRREADRYIEASLVRVGGQVVSLLGTKVDADAEIELLPQAKLQQNDKKTILLNKPKGYLSVHPEKGKPAARELLSAVRYWGSCSCPQLSNLLLLGVAGRLDMDSHGLLVFSDDGTIIKQIIGPESDIEKEYLVSVDGIINPEKLKKLRSGLHLDGQKLLPAIVDRLHGQQLRFILREGKKRQIRRMCEIVGLLVTDLQRIRIGKISLGYLPLGQWRYLRSEETFS